jgi:hypothetical protein
MTPSREAFPDLKFPRILSLAGIAPFYFKDVAFKLEHIKYVFANEDSIFYID